MFEVLIDMGGTFTDGVLIGEDGAIVVGKAESNPNDATDAVLQCIASLAQESGTTPEDLLRNTTTILIGTTLATNCILESKGAKCCVIHTEGFRDIYELGRTIPKTDIYNLKVLPPNVLVPRYLRFGIEERMQYDGEVITPLNEQAVLDAAEKAKAHGVEVPIICFLHSYVNPAHEERAADIIREQFPDVVVSSRITRRWIEYDRLSTATLAAYVKPMMTRFVGALDSRLKKGKFKGTVLFSTSFGSVTMTELCLENPGLLIGSGLAMGALMGRYLSKLADIKDVILCDIGGTSVDTGVLKDQTISTTTESVIGDQKNALETMDIPSIGSGGGAIAWIDDTGVLRVGPTSAGADPGPACYGKGGKQPTLTDANVMLGYIPTDYFLGGAIALQEDLAKQAIDTAVGQPLGMDTVEAAHAISALAEATIAERIFMTVVEKGYDPRDFVLIAAGGAGPVHAIALGSRLKMERVYIPRHAAVFSAFGGATADYGHVLHRFYFKRDDLADPEEVSSLFHSLEEEALAVLERQGVERKDMALVRGAEMRYFGQLRDIDVSLPETPPNVQATEETFRDLVRRFHDRHEAIYGWGDPKLPSVLAMLKVKAIGRRRAFAAVDEPFTKTDASHALKRERQVYFTQLGGYIGTPCYDGDKLKHGNTVVGPTIIEEKRTTIVVPPGWSVAVDRNNNYMATVQ